MQIQIKSLQVKHCGPLEDVEIDFCDEHGQPRPTIVLGGANGSGKTTILELIVELAELIALKITSPLTQLAKAEGVKLNFLVDNTDTYFEYSSLVDENKVTHDLKNLRINLQLHENVSASSHHLPSIFYFPYYRRLLPPKNRQINREDMLLYQWVYRYETVASFNSSLDSYLVWLDYAYPDRFAEIKQYLNEYVLVGKTIDHINRPELATMIKLPNGQTHRLDELSSGEQNLLILMLELRRRLVPGSVVLIDEIENSLHPAFQYQLGEALLKLQAQIPFQLIVTTHAPAFLDVFGLESTLILTEF